MHIGPLFLAECLDFGNELQVDEVYVKRDEAIQMINHVMNLFEIDKNELAGGIDEN